MFIQENFHPTIGIQCRCHPKPNYEATRAKVPSYTPQAHSAQPNFSHGSANLLLDISSGHQTVMALSSIKLHKTVKIFSLFSSPLGCSSLPMLFGVDRKESNLLNALWEKAANNTWL